MFRFILVLGLFVFMTGTSARADRNTAFHDALSEAYGGYRAATSYLRTENPGLASLEIAGALDVWRDIVQTYAGSPPPAYAKDSSFRDTLSGIGKVLEAALAAAEEGDTKAAAKYLTPVRDTLYDLRKRNGVRLYADCITELNRAVEPLYKHRHLTPELGIPKVREQITGESRTYETLLLDCRGMAPKKYTEDPEFIRLFDGTTDSIRSMYPAIKSEDPVRVINVLRELRSFDRIIYFRFGG
ncbi:hypothetical protein L2D14_13580 [Thalassospiraceae bacterium LMO-JJ14]|nr:hypothetical protein L2D14_13580 [Thalassospiraceae bacterium LMO-JJ14]